jgi:hypothetical protein
VMELSGARNVVIFLPRAIFSYLDISKYINYIIMMKTIFKINYLCVLHLIVKKINTVTISCYVTLSSYSHFHCVCFRYTLPVKR